MTTVKTRQHIGTKRASWLRAGILATVAATAVSACTGGGGTSTTSSSSGGDKSSGPKTITYLIGQPEEASDVPVIKADIANFESQNKDVKIKLNILPNDTLRTVLQTQLRSGSGADVFGYDTGPGFAGVLAKTGLLYDLTDAYAKYKWPIYPSAKSRVTFGGKVLGIPDSVDEIGIYYNKTLVPTPPKNLAELQSTMEALKAKGIIPMTFSDKEGWEGGHMLSAPLSSMVGADGMRALLGGKTPWNSPDVVKAIDLFFVQYNKKGFLPKSPNAITYDNANALFYSGKAAMNPTGTWQAQAIEKNVKFPVGFMPFPGPSGPGIIATGLGSGVFVSAKTKNPDAALKFLNYLHTPEHGRWQIEKYNSIPAYPVDASGVKTSPLFKEILTDTSKIAGGQGEFGYNIDVLTSAEFNKAMGDGLQSVLGGRKSAKELADDLQKAYQKSPSGV